MLLEDKRTVERTAPIRMREPRGTRCGRLWTNADDGQHRELHRGRCGSRGRSHFLLSAGRNEKSAAGHFAERRTRRVRRLVQGDLLMRGLCGNRGGRAHVMAGMRAPFTASFVGFGCALVGDYDFERLRPPSAPDHGDASIDSESSERVAYLRQARMHLPRTRNVASTPTFPPVFRPLAKSLGLSAASSRMDAEPSAIADRVGPACAAVVAVTNAASIPVHPKRAPSSVRAAARSPTGAAVPCTAAIACRPKHAAAALSRKNAAARRGPVLRGARNAARFPTAAVKCSTAGLVSMAHRAARMAGRTAADACPPLAKPKTSIAGPFPTDAEAFSTARLACRRRFAGEMARGDVVKRLAGPRPAPISELNAERFPISAAS